MIAAHPTWLRALVPIALAFLCASRAAAAPIPGIPEPFNSGGLSALRVNGHKFVQAIDPTFLTPGRSASASTPPALRTLITSDYTDSLPLPNSGSLSVTSGTTRATATTDGTAGFGKLRASASAGLVGGRSEARAQTVVEFLDLIQILTKDPSQKSVSYDIDWKTDGVITGSAFAVAEVWFIDTLGTLVPPSQFGNLGMYLRSTWTSSGPTDFGIGHPDELLLGNRYWLYGRLRVEANRAHNFFADNTVTSVTTADFMSTAELFIDPGVDTPWASIASASGFDYASPVPEPSILGLATAGLFIIWLAWACKQRRLSS